MEHRDDADGHLAEHDHPEHHHHDHGDHGHPHDHLAHDHDSHGHDHHAHDGHDHGHGPLGLLGEIFHVHHHDDVEFDETLEASDEGIRTLQLSLLGLLVTAAIQLVIAVESGSVGLLADTIHNFSDAFTAIPLWLAFLVARWPANRRYTYGYGRAEDLAGVAIVLVIFASAVIALVESLQRLLHPTPLDHLYWVMAAAVVGFLGNEGVAMLRIRTGRRIGSAALEADGYHAQVDGITSLGVLVGAVAVLLGAPIADPIVGLLISVAIVLVSKNAAIAMWRRMMDAVDPGLVVRAEGVIRATPGVKGVHDLRLRWSGHRLLADVHVDVDETLPLGQAHAIAEAARHDLFHALPRLAEITVHLDPVGPSGIDYHTLTEHHQ